MSEAARAREVKMTWGIENDALYRENSTVGMNDGPRKVLPQPFRYVQPKGPPPRAWFECTERHFGLWEEFQRAELASTDISVVNDPRRLEALRLEFLAYKKRKDPYCINVQEEQAPILYFDFMSNSSETHILDKIEVETYDFEEFKGGGFVTESAGYNIVLCHRPGIRQYDLDKRLKFSAAGHVKLRFFSDNYKPDHGWITPVGAYVLRITFHFAVNLDGVSAATDVFMMDV